MGVHMGFHKTLLKMGKWRFGIGYRVKGTSGLVMLCVYGLMNLMWYSLLACFWIMYGFIWFFFVLPIKGIIKLCKRKKVTSDINSIDEIKKVTSDINSIDGGF